jgi:biopolymer transport protein ExbD
MKKFLVSLLTIFIVSLPFITINSVLADEPSTEKPSGTSSDITLGDSEIGINF